MKRLIFFTYNYPYSHDFSWKRNELNFLKNQFDITVIPYTPLKKDMLDNVPEGIEVLEPLIDLSISGRWSQFSIAIFSQRRWYYFSEFFRKRVYSRKVWLLEWLSAIEMTEKLFKSQVVTEFLQKRPGNENTILYFYWGLGTSLIVPFLTNLGYNKILVRFHGFDLYEERRNGYLPFRTPLLKTLNLALPVSETGDRYLKAKYPKIHFHSKVCRLGSIKAGESKPSEDGTLRIVSSSNIIPLKRVELIAQALSYIDFRLEWTHFGDGELFQRIKDISHHLPSNISVNLPGRVKPEEVLNFYVVNPVDLFLNVSTTEGVPVSIMEAFSAGIPVYATNVGGTSEIVNCGNGKLLDKDITPENLADEIRSFNELLPVSKLTLRKKALETYAEKCDFYELTKQLIALFNA